LFGAVVWVSDVKGTEGGRRTKVSWPERQRSLERSDHQGAVLEVFKTSTKTAFFYLFFDFTFLSCFFWADIFSFT